jgi:hypothetical protein
MIWVVHPGSGSGFFYPCRNPDPGVKKDPDPQHCKYGRYIKIVFSHLLALIICILWKFSIDHNQCCRSELVSISVADPDPGSGAFLTPGSGICHG